MTTALSDAGVQFADGTVQASAAAAQLSTIGASVSGNALTVTLNPTSLDFRSGTLGSGAITRVIAPAAITLTVPSAATLGTVSAVQSDLYIIALNAAGVIELAVVNAAGGGDLSETGLISTTAISASATSAGVVYSAAARTGVEYRVVGLVRSTQTVAGAWATAPALVQGAGGNALDAMMSLGYGQTWQNVTRTSGTTYYNTTGKPIKISVIGTSNTASAQGVSCSLTINGVTIQNNVNYHAGTSYTVGVNDTIPPAASYSFNLLFAIGGALTSVFELR